MKIGLTVPNFTVPGGPANIGRYISDMARAADDAGFSSFWVMDHFFQIGTAEREMLEGYSALAFAAAVTKKLRLGTMVTGITYRHPGILAKTITTLDVLSGGRAYCGIGAAWYEREHHALGVPFPSVKERFELLEETILICLQMWSDSVKPFQGKHFQLAETLNSPQSISRPHPPILIGGGGETKTLKLVAKYADACNLQGGDLEVLKHKLEVLKEHCQREGRNYDDIEKTSNVRTLSLENMSAAQVVDAAGTIAELGVQHLIFSNMGVKDVAAIELVGRDVIPQVAKL